VPANDDPRARDGRPDAEDRFVPAALPGHDERVHLIAVVDDRRLIGECLARGLAAATTTFDVRHHRAPQTLEVAGEWPDLVLLSVEGPADATRTGLAARIARLKAIDPNVSIVVLGDRFDGETVVDLVTAGAGGCISTTDGLQVVLHAIGLVLAGGVYVPADVVTAGSRPMSDDPRPTPAGPLADFTPRQLSVIEGVRKGKSNKLIAYELNMCESTVKVHLRSIMKKLKARNRTEAVYKVAELTS
jgi:DNA-binding NarL/FixJ family response regulator